jgi:cytoskeletal protein CcmA (bactofilin family)
MANSNTTLIEEGTELTGSLSSSCPVVVKGRFVGDVTAPSLTVSASGAVDGKMTVAELRSSGEISGELETDTAELTGNVKDNTIVRAKSLEVKLTPQNGKVELVFGAAGAAEAALARKKRR